MDADVTHLLTYSLRGMFADGGDLTAALAELGWDEVQAVHGAAADALLFREQGRALVASPLLDQVVLAELDELPTSTTRAVAHPWEPENPAAGGVLLVDPAGRDEIVMGRRDDRVGLISAGALRDLRPLGGFGRDTGWREMAPVPEPEPVPVGGFAWRRAIAAAQRALAAELIGLCEAALALTVAHTTNRRQYGRPIGSFQAVRHRIAEAHVAAVSAQDVLDVAVAAATSADGGTWEARIAKIAAGRAQAEIMRSAVQFFGALGVTQESVVHRYVTRAATLDAMYGSHRHLTERLGRELLDGAPLDPVVSI